mgnify:CR=1 FL=1
MPDPVRSSLLDLPPYPAEGYAKLADRIGALLGTRSDVLLVQAEAVVALEAVATSLASPAIRALNIVTSPYGRLFGGWLRRGRAEAYDLSAEPGLPITVDAVAAALDARPEANLVALVHAESASGILNPLPEIGRLARKRGALLVVDAVASVGGHALDVDGLGIDIAVIGPQKALGGPSGVSALSVSGRAWTAIDRPDAPTQSVLSLIDLKRNWLDAGRGALQGMPSALEFWALEAALDHVEAEGLDAVIARHALAAAATRAGLHALGAALWIEDEAAASNLVTAVSLPDGLSAEEIAARPASIEAGLSPGVGEAGQKLIRLNHTGPRARHDTVLAGVLALGFALREAGMHTDLEAAAAAVASHYAGRKG